jgi:hypothetical protein
VSGNDKLGDGPRIKPLARSKRLNAATAQSQRLLDQALELEFEGDTSPATLGFLARTLAQATLPHSDPKLPPGTLYSRNTGLFCLTVAPTSAKYGIPYGSIPRVILAWICTEARRLNSPVLSLGRSQAAFMRSVGMHSNGYHISRFKEQAMRLFGAVFSINYTDSYRDSNTRLLLSDQTEVFWHPRSADQPSLWDSTLVLSDRFFREIVSGPVPIRLPMYHALSKSPMAMDIYAWLTYRLFTISRSKRPSVLIPWTSLQAQIGAGYPLTDQGTRDFRKKFRLHAAQVFLFFPEAKGSVSECSEGLVLTPCRQHIPSKA